MSYVLLGFSTKKNDWLSRMICWATRWRHSHVFLISPDRTLIAESTGIPFPDPLTGEWRTGCRVVPIAYAENRDRFEMRKIAHPDPEKVWQHAVELALQKTEYDEEYFRDWVFRRPKNGNAKKLTCHEYPDVCAALAGQAFLPADMKHTTPRDLYLLSKEI